MSVNTNEDDELRFPNLPPKPRLPDPPTGMNGSAVSYESLRDIFEAFEAREEALQMRIAALSFEPKQSLEALEAIKREHKSFNRYSSAEKNANSVDADDVDPILGVRLLQRLDLLQSENEDLGARIEELMQSTLLKQVEEQAAEIEASPARRLMHLRSRLGELPPAEPWSYCAYSTSSLWRDKGILSGAMEFVGLRQAVACLPLRTGYTVYARGQMYTPMSYRGHWYTSKSGFAASLPNDELRPAGSSKDDASLDSPFYPDISSFMGSLEMDAAAPTMESLHNAEVEMELRETSDVWRETIQLAGQGDESVPHTRAHAFSSIATSVFHAASALQGDTEDAVLRAAASESVNSHGSSSMPSTGENDTITSLHGPFWQQMRRFSYAHRSRLGYQATSAAHGRRTFMSSPSARAMPAGPYELLNVSKSASAKEIKASYYDMVKALHPDRAQAQPATEKEKEMRLEKFRAVVKAYELLKDPKTRSMYDRYGMGWDTSPAGASGRSARNPWAPQNRPSTPAEWEHWYMWSEVLRRAPRGHRASWQYAAADEYTSNRFYGHPNMSKEEAEQRQRENMPLNQQIFAAIFTVTWIVAIFQLQRLNNIGMEHVEAANRHSAEAAKNLEMARQNARSVEGQLRQRALMERVRQAKQARERSSIEALPAPTPIQ